MARRSRRADRAGYNYLIHNKREWNRIVLLQTLKRISENPLTTLNKAEAVRAATIFEVFHELLYQALYM